MPKFKIKTLGCKVNQAESEALVRELLSSNWLTAAEQQKADFCIVNTCAVTQKAAMQSRQAVRRAIRANPRAKIVVTGCYAQTAPHEVQAIEGIDYVVGHAEKHAIGRLLRVADNTPACPEIDIGSDWNNTQCLEPSPTSSVRRTRPFLKIQDGCNAFCTYCIVPHARGRSRSMPLEDVLEGVENLAAAGYREVVLTGIHLGAYGRDLAPATSLSELMTRIEALKPIERIRLSSIEPFEVTGEILELAAKSKIFCRHFHIPLQSGDDDILKKMGRPYSRNAFADLIDKIRRLMPDAAVGVDILVGFPGESEAAFVNTCELVAKLPVSYLHVFPFSARPGTRAAALPDKIDPACVKSRCRRLRNLGSAKRLDFYRKFIGQRLPVLIETRREAGSGLLKGVTSNYLPVLLDAGDELKNRIVAVEIKSCTGQRLRGILDKGERL